MARDETGDTLTQDFVYIPEDVVQAHLKEKERLRRVELKRAPRNHHKGGKNSERPFVMWDGEGPQDTGYSLFGSSAGDEICHPFLETEECLDLILECEKEIPNAIHVWFGSNYDVSMILRQLPWTCLNALKKFNATIWHDYELQHIPHKWLEIKKNGVTAKVFDIHSFFQTSYVNALLNMKIGGRQEIKHLTSEKARRSEFLYSEMDDIRSYWRLELKLGVQLCEKLRDTFLRAGFDVRSWHGPGALANMAMQRHKVFDAMAETPVDVRIAARYAFAGGRFEQFRGGLTWETIYNADKRSAYPAYARDLPNLSRGKWRRGRTYEPGKFAVYRIRYKSEYDPRRVYPLFRRLRDGTVVWPHECEGWYWAPEASLVANDNDAQFLESLIFDEEDDRDRPFAWIEEYYDKRQRLKARGDILEFTFKLIINSIYGQLAQRTGWDRKRNRAPRSHQLEWAGYITSSCRAAVYQVAKRCGDSLVSIDTDGIYSLADFDNMDYGKQLGQWDRETYNAGGIFWQSGIYMLANKTECQARECALADHVGVRYEKGKTRGLPKGQYKARDLMKALEENEPLRLNKKAFIGYGLAVNGQRDKLNTWIKVPHEIVFGGNGKRYHNTAHWCGKRGCGDLLHEFIPRPTRLHPSDTIHSFPHYLPWLENDAELEAQKNLAEAYALYDVNHLDDGEEWVRDYAA
jgi:hypothetical protein